MPGCAASSVLAEARRSITCSPAWIGQPPTSDFLCGHPGDGRYRALPAQQLLDRRRDDLRVLDQLPTVLGLLGEVGEHAVEGVGDRVEARRS